MDNKRMTKATAWTIIKGIIEESSHEDKELLIAKVDNELELLAKKNSAEKKPTAKQTANEAIKDSIVATMEADPARLWTISELTKEVPGLPEDVTPNKISALVRQLKEANIVERIEEKRKAYFRLAH